MSGSPVRRVAIVLLVVGLSLLPLAAAQAAARRGERAAVAARSWSAPDWLAALRGLLGPLWEKDSTPGASPKPGPPQDREGTGIDPHGAPRPDQP